MNQERLEIKRSAAAETTDCQPYMVKKIDSRFHVIGPTGAAVGQVPAGYQMPFYDTRRLAEEQAHLLNVAYRIGQGAATVHDVIAKLFRFAPGDRVITPIDGAAHVIVSRIIRDGRERLRLEYLAVPTGGERMTRYVLDEKAVTRAD